MKKLAKAVPKFYLELRFIVKTCSKILYLPIKALKEAKLRSEYYRYLLNFKIPGGTSRGVLHQKLTYFLKLEQAGNIGIGECALFKGLSCDDRPDYEHKLKWVCDNINKDAEYLLSELTEFPSIQFGLEQALLSLESPNLFELFPSKFSRDEDMIRINGLIWMGDEEFMHQQIKNKLETGFTTLKMKIGAINFDAELKILKSIRKEFSSEKIALRVDANGAFSTNEAMEKLKRLSEFDLHSIEQPIKVNQWDEMAQLCNDSPIPIALDEELIGVLNTNRKEELLDHIKPPYIILKPSLIGGFSGSRAWIDKCKVRGINWWITSALESNIGLNAIAQFTYTLKNKLPQGLGTGGLFTNNINSPLIVKQGALHYDKTRRWNNLNVFLND